MIVKLCDSVLQRSLQVALASHALVATTLSQKLKSAHAKSKALGLEDCIEQATDLKIAKVEMLKTVAHPSSQTFNKVFKEFKLIKDLPIQTAELILTSGVLPGMTLSTASPEVSQLREFGSSAVWQATCVSYAELAVVQMAFRELKVLSAGSANDVEVKEERANLLEQAKMC